MNRLGPVLFAGALLLEPARALACGGLLCSGANPNAPTPNPIAQRAERIAFIDNDDGTFTAIIEILLTGSSPEFAWLLPVSGVPTLGIAPTDALDRLDQATRPAVVASQVQGSPCAFDSSGGCGCGGASDSVGRVDFGADASVSGGPPVIVRSQGNVGPYDYVVIAPDPVAPDPATAIRDYLTANGFPVNDAAVARFTPYLAAGLNLLAFRLVPTLSTDAIRPLVMTYPSTMPVIPLRPTAVAAVDDTQVLVFLYGARRFVPVTYDEVFIHDYQFFTGFTANYAQVVSSAVDEAGGHAFLTEYAGASPTLSFDGASLRGVLASLRDLPLTDLELVSEAARQLTVADGIEDAFQATLPMPPGATVQTVSACASCTFGPSIANFDRAAFLDAIEQLVVEPAELAEEVLARRPHMTRAFTTLDADEMTIDPAFVEVAGLPDVPVMRTPTQFTSCAVSGLLVDGGVLPFGLGVSLPLAERVVTRGFDGVVSSLRDNSQAYRDAVRPLAPPRLVVENGCEAAPVERGVGTFGPLALALGYSLIRAMRRPRA